MLIGCCHCGDASSSSGSASSLVSESAASQPSDGDSAASEILPLCGLCNAVPTSWEIDWPGHDSDCACGIAAQTITLGNIMTDVDSWDPAVSEILVCAWEGEEEAPTITQIGESEGEYQYACASGNALNELRWRVELFHNTITAKQYVRVYLRWYYEPAMFSANMACWEYAVDVSLPDTVSCLFSGDIDFFDIVVGTEWPSIPVLGGCVLPSAVTLTPT